MAAHRLVSALVALAVAAAASGARAESLRLEEAVQLAMAGNERALKAPLRVTVAEGGLAKVRAGFLPTLVASGSATLDRASGASGHALSGLGTLTLTQPLVAPSTYPLYSAAKHALESERWGAEQDKRQLAFDTANAFFLVLTSEQLLEAANRRLELARANEADAAARAKSALASTNDVTLAMVDTASAASSAMQARAVVQTSYIALAFLVGRPVAGPLVAPERTTQAALTTAFQADAVAKYAQTKRPDLKSAQELTAAAQDQAREPLYRLAPTLALQGQLKVTPDATAPDPVHDESAQLTLTWTIFDAGVRYADRKSLVAAAQSTSLDERAARRQVGTDVAAALATLLAARDVLKVSDDGVRAATQNVTEVGILYKQGLARAIEVVDANGRRYDAEVTRATALLAMEQAYLALRFVIGEGPTEAASAPAASAGAAPDRGAP